MPLCPPASNPSATTASTPASWHLTANLLLDTTCATFMPSSFNVFVHVFGLPADVNTTGTFSAIIIFIILSISGYSNGTFTPNGLRVASLHLTICSCNTSGCILPAPIRPSPPASLTAAARRQPPHHTIPPNIMGYSIPNRSVTLFISSAMYL